MAVRYREELEATREREGLRERKREREGQDSGNKAIRKERGRRGRRRIWAVLEGAGLSNRLRKCNAEFYNVRDIHALARARGRVRRLAPASQVVARPASRLLRTRACLCARTGIWPPRSRVCLCVSLACGRQGPQPGKDKGRRRVILLRHIGFRISPAKTSRARSEDAPCGIRSSLRVIALFNDQNV